MELAVLETGGTINGIIDPAAPAPTYSRVVAWLCHHAARLQLQIESRIVVMKDSRAMDDADRARLAAAIEATPARRILIPHGTYTMPATGVYLRRYLGAEAQAKSIVLVGSKIPLGEAGSDAPAALEFAIATLREEIVGVWIAMNGRTWHPAEVVKDLRSGDYIALDDAPVD